MDDQCRELLDEVYADWSRGDFARADFFCDDAEFVFSEEFPDPGVWRGIDGLAAGMRQWLASWEGFSIHPERFVDAGDRVIALVILRARARASGAPLEQSGANVHFFRDGRMSRLEIYPNRDAPLRAVGLAPDSA